MYRNQTINSMKKTILIAAFVAAFFATATAQRSSDNNERARENRTRRESDSRDANVGDRNDNRKESRYDSDRNQNDNNRNNRNNEDRDDRNRREYDRHDNHNKSRGNARIEIYSRGYSYGNRNYGNNNYGYRYGRDDRYNHSWDYAYAPTNWSKDAQLRISDGQRRGLITDSEARRLFRELDRVARCEQDYGRNGYFSQRERENLIDDIRDLNQEISRQMNDDDYYRRNSWFFRKGY
jgi:hypothetical protein